MGRLAMVAAGGHPSGNRGRLERNAAPDHLAFPTGGDSAAMTSGSITPRVGRPLVLPGGDGGSERQQEAAYRQNSRIQSGWTGLSAPTWVSRIAMVAVVGVRYAVVPVPPTQP
jgi:hypothetical protein